jgi:hypothetical protein
MTTGMNTRRGGRTRLQMADALSRAPNQASLQVISSAVPRWITEVTDSYENDEHCTELIAKLTLDSESAPNYTLKSGILRFNKIVVGNNSELRKKNLPHYMTLPWVGILEKQPHTRE